MAGLRKGHSYSREIERAYTRKSKYKKKGYVKAIPPSKIVKFDFGNLNKNYDSQIDLVTIQDAQVRHNAIESARTVVNKRLHELLGTNFHLKIRIFPHHVLRENKMLVGAGADRMQTGMQLAFGRAIGSAAQVRDGKTLFSLYFEKNNLNAAKEAMDLARHRLPCKCKVVVVK